MFVPLFLYGFLQLLVAPFVSAKGLVEVDSLADLGDDYNCPGFVQLQFHTLAASLTDLVGTFTSLRIPSMYCSTKTPIFTTTCTPSGALQWSCSRPAIVV